jgi:hypothetical protein
MENSEDLRCYTVHADFMLSILAATYPGLVSAWHCIRADVPTEETSNAVACVQPLVRRSDESAVWIRRGAITIQSLAECSFAKTRFQLERTVAVMIQRLVMGLLVRIELDVQSYVASGNPTNLRGYDAYIDFVV